VNVLVGKHTAAKNLKGKNISHFPHAQVACCCCWWRHIFTMSRVLFVPSGNFNSPGIHLASPYRTVSHFISCHLMSAHFILVYLSLHFEVFETSLLTPLLHQFRDRSNFFGLVFSFFAFALHFDLIAHGDCVRIARSRRIASALRRSLRKLDSFRHD
jgi:hypothetical protein